MKITFNRRAKQSEAMLAKEREHQRALKRQAGLMQIVKDIYGDPTKMNNAPNFTLAPAAQGGSNMAVHIRTPTIGMSGVYGVLTNAAGDTQTQPFPVEMGPAEGGVTSNVYPITVTFDRTCVVEKLILSKQGVPLVTCGLRSTSLLNGDMLTFAVGEIQVGTDGPISDFVIDQLLETPGYQIEEELTLDDLLG